MDKIVTNISAWGLSADAIAIIIAILIIFKFFKEIIFYIVDRFEETLNKMSGEIRENRATMTSALERIERMVDHCHDKDKP